MEKNQETFSYTYSAQQQEEIKNIRKKYLPPEEDKMERLRKLHHSATQKAQAWALVLGVIGALIMGSGMSLVMTDIAETVGISNPMVCGIVIGVVGMVMAIANYPIYKRILGARRNKFAEEIVAISDKIMKG